MNGGSPDRPWNKMQTFLGEWLVVSTRLMHKRDVVAVAAVTLVACGLLGADVNLFEVFAKEHGHFLDELPEEHGTWSNAVAAAGGTTGQLCEVAVILVYGACLLL